MPANGYALLSPNYRGSTGYGDDFLVELIGRENDIDVKDILAGVDAMIERGIADPDRLAVMGWSNGGFLTNCLITSDPRFKAASSGAGVIDQVIQWGVEDTPGHVINFMVGRLPWADPDEYRAGSPLYRLGGVTTPTLIHVGGQRPAGSGGPLQDALPRAQALPRRSDRAGDLPGRGPRPDHLRPTARRRWSGISRGTSAISRARSRPHQRHEATDPRGRRRGRDHRRWRAGGRPVHDRHRHGRRPGHDAAVSRARPGGIRAREDHGRSSGSRPHGAGDPPPARRCRLRRPAGRRLPLQRAPAPAGAPRLRGRARQTPHQPGQRRRGSPTRRQLRHDLPDCPGQRRRDSDRRQRRLARPQPGDGHDGGQRGARGSQELRRGDRRVRCDVRARLDRASDRLRPGDRPDRHLVQAVTADPADLGLPGARPPHVRSRSTSVSPRQASGRAESSGRRRPWRCCSPTVSATPSGPR